MFNAPTGIDATSYEYHLAVDIQNLKIRKHSQMICVLHNIRYLSFSVLALHSVKWALNWERFLNLLVKNHFKWRRHLESMKKISKDKCIYRLLRGRVDAHISQLDTSWSYVEGMTW